ncbi:MAG: hypothetical protein OCD01_00110 [Fibrobacterales bacterium]
MKIEETFVTTGVSTNPSTSAKKVNNDITEAHHAIVLPRSFSSFSPIVVNNETLGSIEGCLSATIPISCNVETPLYSGDLFGSVVVTGREIATTKPLNLDIPLLNQTRAALAICKDALNRTIDFETFNSDLTAIQLQGSTKEDIINAMFDIVKPSIPDIAPQSTTSHDDTINAILGQVNTASASNSPAQNFVDSVAGSEPGYKLLTESAKEVITQLESFIEQSTQALFKNDQLLEIAGWCTTLNKLIKKTRARNKQNIILISELTIENHFEALEELLTDYSETLTSITIIDEVDASFTELIDKASVLSHKHNTPLFVQPKDSALLEVLAQIHASEGAESTFLFAGFLACTTRSISGSDIMCWKPATLGFLQGVIENSENGWAIEDQLLKLKDQDIIIQNNRSQATQKLLPSEEWTDLHNMRVNSVNGVRNSDVALFMPLVAVK